MSKKSANNEQRSGEEPRPAYAVGYGKPPVKTRFKPGQSGNPKGRTKLHRNLRTVVEDTLNQLITVREGERARTLTKRDALVLRIVNSAIQADPKSLNALLVLLRATGLAAEVPQPTRQGPVTDDDERLLEDYLRRHGSEASDASDDAGKSSTNDKVINLNERRKS